MKPEQAVIYLEDVATILGKKYPAVQSMHARNQLPPSFKLGGRLAWMRATFMAWLDNLEATAEVSEPASEKPRQGRKRKGYEVEITPVSQRAFQR